MPAPWDGGRAGGTLDAPAGGTAPVAAWCRCPRAGQRAGLLRGAAAGPRGELRALPRRSSGCAPSPALLGLTSVRRLRPLGRRFPAARCAVPGGTRCPPSATRAPGLRFPLARLQQPSPPRPPASCGHPGAPGAASCRPRSVPTPWLRCCDRPGMGALVGRGSLLVREWASTQPGIRAGKLLWDVSCHPAYRPVRCRSAACPLPCAEPRAGSTGCLGNGERQEAESTRKERPRGTGKGRGAAGTARRSAQGPCSPQLPAVLSPL